MLCRELADGLLTVTCLARSFPSLCRLSQTAGTGRPRMLSSAQLSVHMLLRKLACLKGRQVSAPTLSRAAGPAVALHQDQLHRRMPAAGSLGTAHAGGVQQPLHQAAASLLSIVACMLP